MKVYRIVLKMYDYKNRLTVEEIENNNINTVINNEIMNNQNGTYWIYTDNKNSIQKGKKELIDYCVAEQNKIIRESNKNLKTLQKIFNNEVIKNA